MDVMHLFTGVEKRRDRMVAGKAKRITKQSEQSREMSEHLVAVLRDRLYTHKDTHTHTKTLLKVIWIQEKYAGVEE